MKKLIERLKYKLPKYYDDVWYNRSVYMDRHEYPKIFDENKDYIDCQVGLKVIMGETENGKFIYYEVIQIRLISGSDWLYSSDAISCKMQFSHIGK